jgi:hypothetical protein
LEIELVDILIGNGTAEPTNYPYIVDTSDRSTTTIFISRTTETSLQEHMNATGPATAATADG